MIPLQLFRSEVPIGTDKVSKVDRLRKTVISQWERETKVLWNAREGEVKEFDLRDSLDRRDVLRLTAMNVTLTSIETRGDWNDEGDDVLTVPATDYYFRPRFNCGLIHLDDNGVEISVWDRLVKVTYDCGYSTLPDEYSDVLDACLLQANFILKRNAGDKMIQTNQGFEGGSTSYEKNELHPQFRKAAKKYKLKM